MMRILALVFASLFVSSMAQRPSFAGSRPIGRPDLASRFKDPSTENINNRVGVVDSTPRPTNDVNVGNTWSEDSTNSQGTQNQNLPSRGGSSQNNDLPRPNRPSFAGSRPVGYPDVAPRFNKDPSTQSVNSRAGGDSTSDGVGSLGDGDFVDRVNTWPRENRPFDVLNSQHIRDHLYNQGNQNVQSRAGFEQSGSQRPSFAGSRPIGRPDVANRFKNVEESS